MDFPTFLPLRRRRTPVSALIGGVFDAFFVSVRREGTTCMTPTKDTDGSIMTMRVVAVFRSVVSTRFDFSYA